MPLKIDVSENAYAWQVYRDLQGQGHGVRNDGAPVAGQPVADGDDRARQAKGLLTRVLKHACHASGAGTAGQLANVAVAKNVNLQLDHSDEVDGGALTRKMDNDWVEIDFVSDRLKGSEKGAESADIRAQRAMAELEHVTVDEIKGAYGGRDLGSGVRRGSANRT